MREINLENLCRLCLSDCFPCNNIFVDCSSSGHVIFEVLKFVYNLEASQDDDLPANICRPCLWKLIEFETYKRNVHNTKTELHDLVKELVCKNRAQQEIEGDETSVIDREESWNLMQEHRISSDNVCDSEDIQCTSLADEVYIKQEREDSEDERDENLSKAPVELNYVPSINSNSNYPVRGKLDLHFFEKETRKNVAFFSSISNSSSLSEYSEEGEPILPDNLCEVESVTGVATSSEMTSICDNLLAKGTKGKQRASQSSLKNVNYSPFQNINIPFRDKENIYVCNICFKCFKCKEELGRHVVFHYNDGSYPTGVRDEHYEGNQNWYRQVKDTLINREWERNHDRESFTCETCGKGYEDKKKLDMHLIRHTNKFSCSFCGKCFGGNRERERHIRIHTQEKPFHCSICEKSFNRKDNLRTHMATHDEQRPSSFRRNARTVKLKKTS